MRLTMNQTPPPQTPADDLTHLPSVATIANRNDDDKDYHPKLDQFHGFGNAHDDRAQAENERYREHTRLGSWLIRFAVKAMSAIIGVLLSIYAYVAITTQTFPDASVFGTFFGELGKVIAEVLGIGPK